jgi:hypothetical protein
LDDSARLKWTLYPQSWYQTLIFIRPESRRHTSTISNQRIITKIIQKNIFTFRIIEAIIKTKVIFYQVKIISDMAVGCHKSKKNERGMYMYARQALYKLKEMDKEWFLSASREVMPLFKESAIPRIADKFRQLAGERLESANIRVYEIYKE